MSRGLKTLRIVRYISTDKKNPGYMSTSSRQTCRVAIWPAGRWWGVGVQGGGGGTAAIHGAGGAHGSGH